MTRKFKITSDRSHTITYAHSTEYLERALSALARQAHPSKPVTILVQDLTTQETEDTGWYEHWNRLGEGSGNG